MDIFDLYAKISLDSTGYTKGINDASATFNKFKSGLGSALADIAKMTAAAVTAGAAAVGKIVKDAVANYGEYEQLVGGIETLFKGSADTVQANAEKAFATAQISANQYMDLVTSFSASLIQSTGRGAQTNIDELKEKQKDALAAQKQLNKEELKAEKQKWADKIAAADKGSKEVLKKQRDAAIDSLEKEQQARITALEKANKKALEDAQKANSQSTSSAQSLERAAKLSDMAVIDMADNANKMGTNMQSIQNAYQGFAKQNYTMLDNLKLGYGGTKSEMERLLKDADALNAKQGKYTKYSVDSFADIVEAIHVVQQELGITGTSSEEASTTIQGSMASVKAAWQDVLTAMGSGKDLDKKLDNFTQSVKKWGQNMKPIISQAVKGAVSAIGSLAPDIAKELPKVVAEIAPDLIKAGADIVTNLAGGIYDAIEQGNFDETAKVFTEKVNDIIGKLDTDASGEKFANVLNKVINAAFNVTSTFNFKQAAEKLTDWCNSALANLDTSKLGQTVSNAWKGVWDFIGTALENIDWSNIGEKISGFINGIDWNGILRSMFKAIGEIIKNAPELIISVVENLDFENAAGFFAMMFAPKMAKKLLNFIKTDSDVNTTLSAAGAAVGSKIGIGADGTTAASATSFIGKLSSGFKTAGVLATAFSIGWEIGSVIYSAIKPFVDDVIDLVQDALDVISGATWEMAKLDAAAKESYSKLNASKAAAKWNEKGYNLTIDDIMYSTDAYKKAVQMESLYDKYSQLTQAGISRQTLMNRTDWYEDLSKGIVPKAIQDMADRSAAYSAVSANAHGVPTSVLNQQAQIYLDTGKLVGGTGTTRAQQTNYTKRGYAT